MRILTIIVLMVLIFPAVPVEAYEARQEAQQQAVIVHIPIPLGARGKPLPVLAGIKENKARIKSMKVSIRSSKDLKETRLNMTSIGKGRYQAIIPAKTTALTSEIVYRIEAETELGARSHTPWYPVRLESLEEKVKETVDSAGKESPKKTGRIRRFMRQHPVSTGVGVAVAVGGGIALASGGGSSGSSDGSSAHGGSYPDSGTAGSGTANISGTWHYINHMPSETITGTMHLTQNGTSVSGTFSEEGDSGTVSGSVNGNSVSLTLNFGGGITDSLSATVNGNQMSGSWHENDTGEHGTFTANR